MSDLHEMTERLASFLKKGNDKLSSLERKMDDVVKYQISSKVTNEQIYASLRQLLWAVSLLVVLVIIGLFMMW